MTGASILRRLLRVLLFARLSANPVEVAKLAVLGFARDNPFGGEGRLGRVLGRVFGAITVRPSLLRGHAVSVNSHDLGQLVSFEEIFGEQIYDLESIPFTPQVVLDCGAQVGYFSIQAAAVYPAATLIAYEPNPENLPWLGRNLAPLGARARIKDVAISDYTGKCHFAAEASNAGQIRRDNVDGIEVKVVDFAVELNALQGQALLLKMDIEGEEGRVLPHVMPALPRQCALFLETHHGPGKRAQSEALLARHGFRMRVLREHADFAELLAIRVQD